MSRAVRELIQIPPEVLESLAGSELGRGLNGSSSTPGLAPWEGQCPSDHVCLQAAKVIAAAMPQKAVLPSRLWQVRECLIRHPQLALMQTMASHCGCHQLWSDDAPPHSSQTKGLPSSIRTKFLILMRSSVQQPGTAQLALSARMRCFCCG